MTLDVVIPNYNGASLLRQFLPSVLTSARRAGARDVVVVDDASTDDSLAVLSEIAPDIRVIRRLYNGGFGEAVNEGARGLTGDLLAVCMTDIELYPDCLEKAVSAMEAPDVFAAGFHLRTSAATGNGGVTSLAFSRGLFHAEFPGEEQPGAFDEPTEIAFALGGATIMRRDVFEELGGFDPVYAPYGWEDIDLCYRAWRSGWRCVNEPKALAWHRHPHTSVQSHASELKREIISLRNRMLFVRRNFASPSLLRQHKLWISLMKLKARTKRNPAVAEADRQARQALQATGSRGHIIAPVLDEAGLLERLSRPGSVSPSQSLPLTAQADGLL
ncbi:MAG: glycosyltransferase family 2 protein [Armatimonadetes bacterium]|nr:glycosyltransferase family 2 protein [Armatimonadota bacterium]